MCERFIKLDLLILLTLITTKQDYLIVKNAWEGGKNEMNSQCWEIEFAPLKLSYITRVNNIANLKI